MSGSKIIGGAIAAVGRAMALPMPRSEGEKARAFAAERLAPAFVQPTPNGPIRFACASRMAYRAVSMAFRNEPETIHWLETHVQPGDCLWDIGANVGAWALYAARARGARVVAFEPSAQTFGALYKNILINRLDGAVDAFCAALSDETGPGRFHLFDPAPGSGLNSLGAPENVRGPFDSRLSQATLAFRMDDFVRLSAVPRPDHLKIDVDGIEEKVLTGALETLPGIKTLIIEDEPARPGAEAWRERVYGLLERAGFVKTMGGPAGANQIFVNERRA